MVFDWNLNADVSADSTCDEMQSNSFCPAQALGISLEFGPIRNQPDNAV